MIDPNRRMGKMPPVDHVAPVAELVDARDSKYII